MWQFSATVFKRKMARFKKLFTHFIILAAPIKCKTFASDEADVIDMGFLRENSRRFLHYQFALLATDVISQQASYPCVNMMEVKLYLEGKHKLHCFKIKASMLSNGMCICFSGHSKAEEADISIFHSRLQNHKFITEKVEEVLYIIDLGDGSIDRWAVIAGEGYQG